MAVDMDHEKTAFVTSSDVTQYKHMPIVTCSSGEESTGYRLTSMISELMNGAPFVAVCDQAFTRHIKTMARKQCGKALQKNRLAGRAIREIRQCVAI